MHGGSPGSLGTANLLTKILDFREFDASIILSFKGWNSHVPRGFPGNYESTNLSMHNLSREIGRNLCPLISLSPAVGSQWGIWDFGDFGQGLLVTL